MAKHISRHKDVHGMNVPVLEGGEEEERNGSLTVTRRASFKEGLVFH